MLYYVIDSVESARGSAEVLYVFSQDGNNYQVSDTIDSIYHRPGSRVIHLRHMYPLAHILPMFRDGDAATTSQVYFLLRFAFSYLQARAAIVLESDVVLAPDALSYFQGVFESIDGNASTRSRVMVVNGANDPHFDEAWPAASKAGGRYGDSLRVYPAGSTQSTHTLDGTSERDGPELTRGVAAAARPRHEVLAGGGGRPDPDPNGDGLLAFGDPRGFRGGGWLCPAWSWDLLESRFAGVMGWQSVVERVRRTEGLLALSPIRSKTAHLPDAEKAEHWPWWVGPLTDHSLRGNRGSGTADGHGHGLLDVGVQEKREQPSGGGLGGAEVMYPSRGFGSSAAVI